jgi:predicted lipoprotein with Yx(FWY)xxD motif
MMLNSTPSPTTRNRWSVGALLGGAALVAAACSSGGNNATHSPTVPLPATSSAAAPHTTAPAQHTTAPTAHTIAPAVLETMHTRLGTVLADRRGRTVYVFTADRPGHSACIAGCLRFWPVVNAPQTILPRTATGARLGALTRTDSGRQLTVNGYPVYTFARDTAAGQAAGQGLLLNGGTWWALTPTGARITTGETPTPTPTHTPAPPAPSTMPPPPMPAGIPQLNGGDHDGDNNGGPSDGDGDI